MCVPAAALPLMAAISGGLAAVGGGIGALQAASQARYQAKIADRNAALEREAGQQELENTRQAAMATYRKASQVKGAQRVAAAANGVALDFGTAGDVQADTNMLVAEDVQRIYEQGAQNRRGRDIGASNYMAEAGAQRQAASGALVKGVFDFGSTVLGSASQYARLKGPSTAGLKLSQRGS